MAQPMSPASHVSVTLSVVSMVTAAPTMTQSAGVAEVRKLQIVANNILAILAPTVRQKLKKYLSVFSSILTLKLSVFISLIAGMAVSSR